MSKRDTRDLDIAQQLGPAPGDMRQLKSAWRSPMTTPDSDVADPRDSARMVAGIQVNASRYSRD